MGRQHSAKVASKLPIPTLEQFRGIKHDTVSVGTSVATLPTIGLRNRKAILIQNKHASNVVYLGGGLPYILIGDYEDCHNDEQDWRHLGWFLSSSGTNEWYMATYNSATGAKTAPSGMTQITYLYYTTIGGTATLATEGTVGSLAAEHRWGWGTTADVTGNTMFIRTNGASPGNSPKYRYEQLEAYYFTLTADDTTNTGGIELAAGNSMSMTLDGSSRIFAIASGASTPVGTLEFI